MGKGKNLRVATSKGKATEGDQDATLGAINNPEFMVMRVAEKIWPAPSPRED
jgi:hypothetical protein